MSTPLPCQPNVGIALFNAAVRVFIARQLRDHGPKTILLGREWQMPQGGIDPGEDPRPAALRELYEVPASPARSTSARPPTGSATTSPPYDGPPHRLARFRGQWQSGSRSASQATSAIDVAIERSAGATDPEFGEWR